MTIPSSLSRLASSDTAEDSHRSTPPRRTPLSAHASRVGSRAPSMKGAHRDRTRWQSRGAECAAGQCADALRFRQRTSSRLAHPIDGGAPGHGVRRPDGVRDYAIPTHPFSAAAPLLGWRTRSMGCVRWAGVRDLKRGA
jgi:hypothetical protein